MDAVDLLRQQFQAFHHFLEGTVADVSPEVGQLQPGGTAMPIGAVYVHVVNSEDRILSGLVKGEPPLEMTAWAGKLGTSEPAPMGPPWNEWAGRVQVDLAAAREYAQAVYANTDAYLAGLSAADLDRGLDLSGIGLGQQTVGSLMSLLLWNAGAHCGEVSLIKGLQGLKGYPV
ncbi:MAG: DinB family protein [Thermomicrobiales bacterium]